MRNIAQIVMCMMIAAVLGLVPGIASQAAAKPLKVFILAGQSNMEGHGGVKTLDQLGEHPTHGYPPQTRVAFGPVRLAQAGDVEDKVWSELKHH